MTTFVIGGAGSGKSAYAERLAAACPPPRFYVATMQVWDQESQARVERHRQMRQGKGFETLECPLKLKALVLPQPGAVLLEDLSNLAANELFEQAGAGPGAFAEILEGLGLLRAQCAQLIIVGNEIFCGGDRYAGNTLSYLKLLAALHRQIAAWADNVCEVAYGQPVYYKGREPL